MSRPDSAAVRRGFILAGLYVLCIAVALALSALLVAITGGPWRSVLSALLDGSLREPGRLGTTLTAMAPVLIVSLGAILSSRAGLVNIGQEGQLAIGAACATWAATRWSGPMALVAALVFGMIGGAAWAGIAAVLKYWRKVPEVISTLLLVFIAAQLTGYMLTRVFLLLDPNPNTPNRVQQSAQLDAATRIGVLRTHGNEIPWSLFASVILAIVVSIAIHRTVWGFRLTVLGRNARTAQRIGVPVIIAGATALALGGAFAGLAGAAMLATGTSSYRFTPGFANNVGWEGLLVALVARNRPLACIPVAFVFAMLRTGSGFLAATGVERSIVDVVRALLVLAMLAPPAIMAVHTRRVAPPPAPVSTEEPVVARVGLS